MSRIETILLIVVIFIFIIYASLMSYLMYSIYLNSKNSQSNQSNAGLDVFKKYNVDVNSQFHTDFFNKSSILASEVLFGKSLSHEYGDPNYYANKLIDVVNKINDDTKKSIVVAIKYMGIEPAMARENEKIFRNMAEIERVPVWFVILREATRKVVPEFSIDQNIEHQDNIVPLYKTG